MQRKIIGVIALVGLWVAAMPSIGLAAPSLQSNLLTNGGFEQPYDDGKQANGWGRWFERIDKPGDGSLDYAVNPTFSAEVNPVIVRGGSAAQHIGNRYDPWHAGVKQVVSVPAGSPLQFCAYGRLFASNEDFEKAPSWEGHNGHMKVGIFPNGDAEWNSGGIIWSAEANPHNAWQQICVSASVGDAGKVTVFTSSSYRGTSAFHLDAWWDDASLVVTAPPATATPTAPAAPPVVERVCETRDDGSVVYVVQSGDTLGAIAIACDSTVEAIQQLNGLTDTLIDIGQTLIVKGPTVPPTAVPEPTPEAAPTEAAPPTPEPIAVSSEGEICVQAFNDANANQTLDVDEQLLGGVGFALSDVSGARGSYVTSGLEPEPYCFAGLRPGSYTIEARPPAGVASTTSSEWPVGLTGGMQFSIAYGGARGVEEAATSAPADTSTGEDSTPSGESTSDLGRLALGGLGILILIAAGFMASQALTRARR
jgi:LysM repeat protein